MHTMTKKQVKSGTIEVKTLLAEDEEFLRALVRTALQEVLVCARGFDPKGEGDHRGPSCSSVISARSGRWLRRCGDVRPARHAI
jgi:hypothetical protein